MSQQQKLYSLKHCRDQARDELWLMMGGGAIAGAAGGVPLIGTITFETGLTAVEIIVVTRIAQVYGFDLIPAGGAGAVAGVIVAIGGGELLSKIGGGLAGIVPLIGQFVQPAIGAIAVKAFGEAAIAYFENMYPDKIYNQY